MVGYPSPSSWKGAAIRTASIHAVSLLCLIAATLSAQAPVPAGERVGAPATSARELVRLGSEALDREDAVEALRSFRDAWHCDPADLQALVGVGRAQLQLGRATDALATAREALGRDPQDEGALALSVRALIRLRDFDGALRASSQSVESGHAGASLMAAHGSALYRVQRNEEAAQAYRRVVELDPLSEEAHARLGSGLTAPCTFTPTARLRQAILAMREARLDDALEELRAELAETPDQPVVHRLIGEVLFQQRASRSIVETAACFATVRRLGQPAAIDPVLASDFVPAFAELGASRREVVTRTLATFEPYLAALISKGARHDFLLEEERTTDDPARASLRGKRTFDGRVWDDVRGIGGLRAATGIEALDEAALCGFDTFAHEVAHQVHLHVLRDKPVFARIRELYRHAIDGDRVLDYYAASNWAEYFGQGVEAFVSLAKRPEPEATHAHTRFELMRVDPELHTLIAGLVAFDPLGPTSDRARRAELLRAAIDAALLMGRTDDAATATELLDEPSERVALRARIRGVAAMIDGH
ncbi:MAG: tetratricopeptide repeat protein [Planctomycetota bacterium]